MDRHTEPFVENYAEADSVIVGKIESVKTKDYDQPSS
jgi:hypothetical protein